MWDLGEIQNKIREIQIKNIFCLDCRPEKFKTVEIIQPKTEKSKHKNPGNPNIKPVKSKQ
jgi:hypothetical protein